MINIYSKKKKEVLNQLRVLDNQLDKIKEEISSELYTELKDKIKNGISNIENEKFTIAFFGAFSDGKSTILSALTKLLDIKISVEPTTDEVKFYEYEDYFIVDTPGLFSDQLMHEEKTKKYISEANLIIYAVDAVNPLKESHHKILKWLLKDLGKMNSTIFVINKMDEVSDLEDEEDFKRNCEIKKKVVEDVLKEVVGVSNFKRIVCVSGDPFELGLREWFNKENDYRKLSRIGDLENKIHEFIGKAKEELVINAGLSVIKDTIKRTLNQLESLYEKLKEESIVLDNQIKEYRNSLDILERDISDSYTNIKKDILLLRADILQEIETASDIQSLSKILKKRIGQDGFVIQNEIDLIIRKHTETLMGDTKKFIKNIGESLEYHSNLAEEFISMGKDVVKPLRIIPTRQIADTILKIRDLAKLPIKFKPWGAVKWAKRIKGIPVVIELIELGNKIIGTIRLEKKKEKTIEEIEGLFQSLFEDFTSEEYRNEYFPHVSDLQNILKNLEDYKAGVKKSIENMEKITTQLKNFA